MMHQFSTGSSVVTLTRQSSSSGPDSGAISYTDNEGNVISTANVMTTDDPSLVGNHFLTNEEGEQILTKIELESQADVDVIVKHSKKFSTSLLEGEKKVCLWPQPGGGTCGKTFTKLDSLKRHLAETHKGVRPYACTLCDKTYGRRDYLQRHLKSHNANYAVNLASASGMNAAQVVQAVTTGKLQNSNQDQKPVIMQIHHATNGMLVPTHKHPAQSNVTSLPFLSLGSSLVPTKPMGSKICRWVLNDGTVCGKAFSKLDSLRRHVNELHKGVRPFACNLCEKSYGRRDYLERHRKVHEKITIKGKSVPNGSLHIDWGTNMLISIDGGEPQPMDDESSLPPPEPKVIKKKRKDIPAEEKKICLWVLEDGTACGKTFTKFDSLKRHVSEAHKGVRPYSCSLCGKSYGRRDYLLRHLESHNEVDVATLASASTQTHVNETKPLMNHQLNHVVGMSPDENDHHLLSHDPDGMLSVSRPVPQPSQSQHQHHQHHQHHLHQQHQQHHQHQQHQQRLAGNGVSLTSSSGGGGGGVGGGSSGNLAAPSVKLSKKRIDDKKTCRWVLDNGTVCGRSFSKFDSLRRHVQELHKGIRPYICGMCEKSYGRRDYLERHMKTHTDADVDADADGDADADADVNGVDPDCILGVSEDSEVCSLAMSGDEDDEDMGHDDSHDVVVTTDD